jgi:hypothetical protein
MGITREQLEKGMREIMEMEARMEKDPEYRAKVEQEGRDYEERYERRLRQPKRVAIRKDTIKRIQDFYWHVSRHEDRTELIHRMDKLGKQGHGGSIDDAVNFMLDLFEKYLEYSKW